MRWISSFYGSFPLIPDPTEIARLSPLHPTVPWGSARTAADPHADSRASRSQNVLNAGISPLCPPVDFASGSGYITGKAL
jgi:hypothetical protein